MTLDFFSYSDVGGRRENEDSAGAWRNGDSFAAVVADGLGGQGDGKAASRFVCDELLSHLSSGGLPDAAAIEQIFDQANRKLISRQKNSFHMKTTAVYLYIYKNRAIWAHIGDSRLYHLYNGKLCGYTLDHSAAQLLVYMGKITREQIPDNPGQSRLLRAMGVEDDEPDIHDPIVLDPGRHAFLLCSDGLWEYLSDADIERVYAMADSPEQFVACARSLKDSRSPENCDNHSAVVVYMDV